jgi:CRP-like cAMP-binding protein
MASNDKQLALIEQAALFEPLDAADRKALLAEMRPVSFEAGQAIFSRGDTGRDVYLVTNGRVRLSVLTAEGRELSFAHAEAGSVFGEIAMLDEGPRSADATAVVKTEALSLGRAAFMRLAEKRPHLVDAVVRFLCRRIRDADQQLEAIALCPIEVRLARFFLAAARQRDPEATEGKVSIDLGMSQSELALLIGASRPKVNTALSMLESGGAITRKGSQFVCDVEELANTAALE